MNILAHTLPQTIHCPDLGVPMALMILLTVRMMTRDGRQAAEGAFLVARLFLGAALTLAAGAALAGPLRLEIAGWGAARLAFLIDPLSVTMLLLVSFLGVVITRYSINYLDGDPGQGGFSRWLLMTLASVLVLVMSSNLLLFAVAWISTSLSLHQLLTFYRGRAPALTAARKKFIISRLADACVLAVLVLVWQGRGTWEFHELFASPRGAHTGLIAGLLVAAAMLKSAQFPFHSWLPDTLETPTPVSALMHAGVINAGGFLIVRLSPLVAESSAALNVLAVAGAFTALFGSVVMMTQTSIKKSLAWSTVAQMGFMMLQCGLGAFALAMLHLAAHSLYKAHAFLSSGSVVNMARSAWTPAGRPAAHPLVVLGALGTAVLAGAGLGVLTGSSWSQDPGEMLLISIFIMALSHLLWTLWSSSLRSRLILHGAVLVVAATVCCLGLHACFEHLLAGAVPDYAPQRSLLEHVVMGFVGLLFLAVLIFQSQLPDWGARPALARFYVHASNGFYLGTLLSRITRKLGA